MERDSQEKEPLQIFLVHFHYLDVQQKQLLKLFLSFLILAEDGVTRFKIMLLSTLEHGVSPTADNTW